MSFCLNSIWGQRNNQLDLFSERKEFLGHGIITEDCVTCHLRKRTIVTNLHVLNTEDFISWENINDYVKVFSPSPCILPPFFSSHLSVYLFVYLDSKSSNLPYTVSLNIVLTLFVIFQQTERGIIVSVGLLSQ